MMNAISTALLLQQAFLPRMRTQGSARSSISFRCGQSGLAQGGAGYVISKFGMAG